MAKSNVLTASALVALLALGLFSGHAYAQVNFGDPVAFMQSVARAVMVAAGSVMVVAGGYKAVQVWSGNRQLWDASTALLGGAALVFGTAASVGL